MLFGIWQAHLEMNSNWMSNQGIQTLRRSVPEDRPVMFSHRRSFSDSDATSSMSSSRTPLYCKEFPFYLSSDTHLTRNPRFDTPDVCGKATPEIVLYIKLLNGFGWARPLRRDHFSRGFTGCVLKEFNLYTMARVRVSLQTSLGAVSQFEAQRLF